MAAQTLRQAQTRLVLLLARPNQVSQAQALAAFSSPVQILRTKVELASKAARKAKALPTRTLPPVTQCQLLARPNQVSQAQALAAFSSPAQILRTKVELASKAARKAKALPTRTLPPVTQCQGSASRPDLV